MKNQNRKIKIIIIIKNVEGLAKILQTNKIINKKKATSTVMSLLYADPLVFLRVFFNFTGKKLQYSQLAKKKKKVIYILFVVSEINTIN